MTGEPFLSASLVESAPRDGARATGGDELSFANTHLLLEEFDLLEPETLEVALKALADGSSPAKVLAGGTDLLVQMKMERQAPTRVVSLARIPGMAGIEAGNGMRIGAMASIRDVETSAGSGPYAALAEACRAFSTVQIMTMATLGGNICNASPAADTAPALLAFGASARIASPAGGRDLALEAFFAGPGRTALQPGEVLVSIDLPPATAATGSAFLKLGRVSADISKVCAAVRIDRDGDLVVECRIALGAVAPTPVRCRTAEAVLAGERLTAAALDEAATRVEADIAPISDVRSTADYRLRVARVLVRDALRQAWSRSGGGEPG